MSGEFSCVIHAWRAHESELRGYLSHRIGNTHPAEDPESPPRTEDIEAWPRKKFNSDQNRVPVL